MACVARVLVASSHDVVEACKGQQWCECQVMCSVGALVLRHGRRQVRVPLRSVGNALPSGGSSSSSSITLAVSQPATATSHPVVVYIHLQFASANHDDHARLLHWLKQQHHQVCWRQPYRGSRWALRRSKQPPAPQYTKAAVAPPRRVAAAPHKLAARKPPRWRGKRPRASEAVEVYLIGRQRQLKRAMHEAAASAAASSR